ncbi:MAG TPA: hypothetical protein VMW65_18580 [Chloroflexota bacterium]|nr:hypothetical protein [Chloroflexota bacterium]
MNEKKGTGTVPEVKRKADKEVVLAAVGKSTQSHANAKPLKGTAKWRAGQLEGNGKAQESQKEATVPDAKNDFWHKVRPSHI